MSGKIPGIPPYHRIEDRAVRAVIEALVTGWAVRNGDSQDRFMTETDIIEFMRSARARDAIRDVMREVMRDMLKDEVFK